MVRRDIRDGSHHIFGVFLATRVMTPYVQSFGLNKQWKLYTLVLIWIEFLVDTTFIITIEWVVLRTYTRWYDVWPLKNVSFAKVVTISVKSNYFKARALKKHKIIIKYPRLTSGNPPNSVDYYLSHQMKLRNIKVRLPFQYK